jgi:GT2 family glycosyltransferase
MVKDKSNSVSVILPVLIHNRFLLTMTVACIQNVREFINPDQLEFIVIHNQSQMFPDDIQACLTKDDVYIPVPNENLRLGKCLNMGIEKASSKYLLILANDVMVHHDFFPPLKDSLQHLDFAIPWLWRFGNTHYELAQLEAGTTKVMPFTFTDGGGNCCLFTRETYEKVGKFNEELFIKCDRDYLWRIEQLKLKTGMCVKSHATHLGSMTWRNEPIDEKIFGKGFLNGEGWDNTFLMKKYGRC